MKAVSGSSAMELAACVTVADSFFARLKGLLGTECMQPGEGLWIIPCSGIHTFGMRFPIDLLILDREQRVVNSVSRLPPNRMTALYRYAASVLELPAGTLDGRQIEIGERIVFL
jgi:uncharacterized membrane protein (UPF0127 family)